MSGRSHGTPGRYQEGCKCDLCTDRNTSRIQEAIARREGREPLVHNASTYRNWNCKCDVCTADHRALVRRRQRAAGRGVNRGKEWTTRELEVALEMLDGRRYVRTALEVAVELGRSVPAVNRIRSSASARVSPSSVAAAPSGESKENR